MKDIKHIIAIIIIPLVMALGLSACNTTQQRTAYNTIFTVEQTATTAYDGYCALVIKGIVPTNDVAMVSLKFNQLQLACTLASATAQNGTNALATANLTAELVDLTALISTLEPPSGGATK